jgi:hypothetical protein
MAIKLVSIKPSDKAGKKMMATFEVDGKQKTVHFGSSANKDFTIYYKTEGKEKADKMRNAYIARHKVNENWKNPMSAGALSRYVLWEAPTIASGIRAYKSRFGF